jgi:hypothetical protein
MVIQFTLQELMVFLVCALTIVAGCLLIPILWNIKKVVGIVRPMVETNQAAIKKSIVAIPGIIENLGQISIDVRETTDKLKISVPILLQEAQGAGGTADAAENATGLMAYFPVIKEALHLILRAFSSGK